MKKRDLTPNRIIAFFAMFFLLTIDTSFFTLETFSGTLRLIIAIVSIAAIILTRFQKTVLSNQFFTRVKRTISFFIISLILPVLYGNYNMKQMIIMVVIWVVGYLVVLFVLLQKTFSGKRFLEYITKKTVCKHYFQKLFIFVYTSSIAFHI